MKSRENLFLSFLTFRLEAASLKLNTVAGSKRAIKILSSNKFPKPSYKFVGTFEGFTQEPIDFNYRLSESCLSYDDPELRKCSDKLQFFHLRDRTNNEREIPTFTIKTSINSAITFLNSANNDNIILNALDNHKQPKPSANETSNDSVDFNRISLKRSMRTSLIYLPSTNQAPEIELPQDLPNLAGIADDISFSTLDNDFIVPSSKWMKSVDLPNIAELIEENDKAKALIPPPPPEIAKLANFEQSSSSQVEVIPPPIPNIAPPPPPPNFMKAPEPITKAIPVSPDARSSLMQAIRGAAGKAKLRAATNKGSQDTNEGSQKKKLPPATGGDLMSDLHAKLALRRRGIAGTNDSKKKASIMDKVSSLIPPPRDDASDGSSSESDSEWE